jgi:hypothetical protein
MLATYTGKPLATQIVDQGRKYLKDTVAAEAESFIRSKAEAGAKQAIPQIRAEVRATVKPYVITSIVVASAGFLAGLTALVISIRKRRA